VVVLLLASFTVYGYRIRVEEKALVMKFGACCEVEDLIVLFNKSSEEK